MFRAGVNVGVDIPAADLRREFDAIVLCGGAGAAARPAGAGTRARRHPFRRRVPHPAEPPLRRRRRFPRIRSSPPRASGSSSSAAATPAPTAWARRTGRARCRCTSSSCCRARRSRGRPTIPWPQWPRIFRSSSAHEEGGERLFSISTERFVDDGTGRVRALETIGVDVSRSGVTRIPGTERDHRRRSGAAGDGLRRPGTRRAARRARRPADRARQRLARRAVDDQRRQACSPPATCSAGNR